MTIGEIPPIRRAALAAVGKKARVALVCGETESVADLLQRLNVALGKAAAEDIVIDEVFSEIKRRRYYLPHGKGPLPHAYVPGGADALLNLDRSVASGRSLQEIAMGQRRSPKPFMLATKNLARPNAVWQSNRGEGAASSAIALHHPDPVRSTKAAKPVLVKAIPRFIEPQLCKLVSRPPGLDPL